MFNRVWDIKDRDVDGKELKAMLGRNLKLLRADRQYSQAFLAEQDTNYRAFKQ